MLDLWQFQRREIESLRLQSGEDSGLENERRVLQNLGRILETAGGAYAALYDSPESAVVLARLAAKKLEELGASIRRSREIRETLKPAEIALSEASYALRDYLGGTRTPGGSTRRGAARPSTKPSESMALASKRCSATSSR